MMHDITYNDIPDFSGYCPDCPECGHEMRYSHVKGEFKCFNCGFTMDEEDWEMDDEGEMPWCCVTCGGPYPDCMAGCKIFDD